MTRKEQLAEMIAKVETGDTTNDGSMFRVFGDKWTTCFDAFHGSLDAAKALHEAVLPGLPVSLTDMSQEHLGSHGWIAKINWPHTVWNSTFTTAGPFAHLASSDNPARAWLLAILRALHAQEPETP